MGSFFNNIGATIDIANAKVKEYINGTPKKDKWVEDKLIPYIERYANSKWNEKFKRYFIKELKSIVIDGITESMIDDNGCLDPNIVTIVNIKIDAFIAGWNSQNDSPRAD